MKTKLAAAIALIVSSAASHAAMYHFDGNISYHNDIVTTSFTLDADATNVRVWTDSHKGGINFDPMTALWNAATGQLIRQNDDDSSIHPGQTSFDSGFQLPSLEAGTYFFTVATYSNSARGTNIADGFTYSQQAPIAMSNWCQPFSGCNMGTYWSVWLDGVTTASTPNGPGQVPEPGTLALLGIGLAGLARHLKRKQSV